MARLLAAFALTTLVACGAGHDRGPAWPKRTDPEVDGGESLAPRTTSFVAAKESEKETKSDDKVEEKAADTKAADKPAADAKTTTITAPDDVIIIDDIVIEIED